jgi:glycosyltransferase involved in cell wall biosynthesis
MCGNIICVSEEVRKAIQCFLKHDHKFHVIPAFIGATDMDQSFSETTARFLEKHTPVISTVAHFSPEYGLRVLLEAVAKVKEKFEKLGLIVIGEGEEKEINRRIEDLGIKQNVLIRNGLEHSKCIYSIKHTDLFIRPSYIDGDSIAVREAIYLGIPVLASDAVKRPPQACLFKTGDVENLKDKIELMLGTQPGIPLAGRNNVDGDTLGKILKLYRVTGH